MYYEGYLITVITLTNVALLGNNQLNTDIWSRYSALHALDRKAVSSQLSEYTLILCAQMYQDMDTT